MLLFSCKKDNSSSPDSGKTYATTFTVNSFGATGATTFAAAAGKNTGSGIGAHSFAAAIPVATKYLTALFYDANSNLLQRVDQTQGSAGYGTITVQLPLGTVIAFFVATDDNSFKINISKANPQGLKHMPNGYPYLYYPSAYFGPTTTNLFSTVQPLNITAPSTQNVVLTRIASQITVKVDDYIAANTSYYYDQNNPRTNFDLLDQTSEHIGQIVDVTQGLNPTAGTTGYSYTVLVYPGTGSTHSFGGYVSSTPLSTKTLFAATDTIKPNTKYTFEGFISNMRTTTSTIKTDTTWSAPINKTLAIKTK